MATQTVILSNPPGSNFTYNGVPGFPDDDYFITDTGGANYTITLGNGTDQLTLLDGNNTLTLGNGPDQIMAGAGNNTITTGTGNSTITVGNGNDTITVGTGGNTIVLGTGLDTVSTEAGNNVVSVSGATVSGDTLNGALTSLDGTTNQLVLTAAGTMSPVNVSGFASYQLANGGLNSLTLSETNFARLPGGRITVSGGNSGNTVNASALSAAHSVTIDAGAGIDALTGGAGNDRFVFTPSNLSGDTVDGGTGINTLELAAGGAGTLNGLGTNFVNISTIVLDANATWAIGISNPAAFTGTISGFVPGDTFDLTNLAFGSGGSATVISGNVLQIAEKSGTVDLNLDPNQSFTGDTFHLAPDSGSGTLVTEVSGGSNLAFFANELGSANISAVLTTDGSGVPAPDPTKFNIEVFTATAGGLASGYAASAFIQGAVQTANNVVQAGTIGSTEQLLDGSFALVDQTGFENIQIVGNVGGGSNDTVIGSTQDTITGSSNANNAQLIDASLTNGAVVGGAGMTVTGGAGNTTVWGGSGDSITGGAGALTVVGGVGGIQNNNMVVTGGPGGLQAFDFGAGNSVTGGGGSTFIDDGYGAGGGHNTITGGSGSQNFIKGNATDTLIGGTGATPVIDATLGTQSVTGGTDALLSFAVKIEGGQGDTINTGLGFANQVYVDLGHQTVTGSNNAQTGAFTLVFGGPNDSIVGGVDKLVVPGAAGANTTIVGGAGDLIAVNLGVGDSVVGGSATTLENDSYGAGGNATLIGGSGTTTATSFNGITVASAVNTLIVAGSGDSIVAGAGTLEARIKSNLAGVETVNLSAAGRGATEVRDISVAGGAGATASVTGFSTATDQIASATSTSAQLIASAGHDGAGNLVLNFQDHSTMTIVGVTDVSTIAFAS